MSAVDDLIRELETNPAAAENLARLISDDMVRATSQQHLDLASHSIQQRWMNNGTPIVTDSTGQTRDVTGEAYFDSINIVGGSGTLNAANPRQLDLTVAGAGAADCMFDYLVSSCWTGTAGQSFISASGCTFKMYATIGACVTQAATDFPGGGGVLRPAIIYICRGTYAESNIILAASQKVQFFGSGQDATVIGGTSAANPGVVFDCATNTGQTVGFHNMTLKANHSSGAQLAHCVYASGAGRFEFEDVKFIGGTGINEYALGVNVTLATGLTFNISHCFGTTGYVIESSFHCQGTIADNTFDTCTVAVSVGEDSVVSGNWFKSCDIAVQVSDKASDVQISGNHVVNSTGTRTFITTLGRTANNIHVMDNTFDGLTTFIDATSFTNSPAALDNNLNWDVINNRGQMFSGGVGLAFTSAAGKFPGGNWVVKNNSFDASTGVASLTSGNVKSVGMKFSNNYVATGSAATNVTPREPVDGGLTQLLTGDIYWVDDDNALVIGCTATAIRFGDTITQVARQTAALATATGVNYYEINPAGTFSCNAVGFTSGSYPVVQITTSGSVYASHVNSGGVLFVGAGGSGGGTGGGTTPFSIIRYAFAPDAAPGVAIGGASATNPQGLIVHSGPSAETATKLYFDAETVGTSITIVVAYGDTDSLATVASWTTIATLTGTTASTAQTTMTNASIPADRLVGFFVTAVTGTWMDGTCVLRVKSPLSA